MVKKIPEKIKKIVGEYISELEDDIDVDRVILFGSQVTGRASGKSDIDVAIISDFFDSKKGRSSFLFRKLWNVKNANIDPVGYSSREFCAKTPSPLLAEIRKHGMELKINLLHGRSPG